MFKYMVFVCLVELLETCYNENIMFQCMVFVYLVELLETYYNEG